MTAPFLSHRSQESFDIVNWLPLKAPLPRGARGSLQLFCGVIFFAFALLLPTPSSAEVPGTAYIFPLGGQRGTTVNVRIGGHFLYEKSEFTLIGPGVEASSHVERTKTLWLEGPVIPQPASQQKEDYPKDYSAQIKVAANAPTGLRFWYCATSQGIAPGMRFVVGDLPEVIEEEISGTRAATPVALPVTINGRIFPREDVDDWSFAAKKGQVITCEVNAARLGSGLDSRLEVLDPQGRVIAENADTFGLDSFVRFTAPEDGTYLVRIHDIRFEGLQHYVYRLTISAGAWLDRTYPLGGRRGTTVPLQLFGANLPSDRMDLAVPPLSNPSTIPGFMVVPMLPESGTANVRFETDDLAEQLEVEPNDEPAQANKAELPSVLNGRIERPGDVDHWTFVGKKGDAWQFDLRASRLGSALDGVLTLLDEKGQQVATADDLANGQTDAVLAATLSADGNYTLKVEDRISSRGASDFAYRIRIARATDTVLRLVTPLDAVTLLRGGELRVNVLGERPQGLADEIDLNIEGLPEGVTVIGNKLGKGQNQVDVVFKAADMAKVVTSRLRIVGKWKIGETEHSAVTTIQRPLGEPESTELLLRVGVPTPFKLKGIFETKFAPRGSVFVRRYRVERSGFTGLLTVEMADRQARHLQGVTGPKLTIPADVSEFDYPVTLPPYMEIGRTSRTCVALIGEVVDADGSKHIVSHTSQNQDDQTIVLVDPNRLSLETRQPTVRFMPGSTVRIPVRVSRGTGLRGAARVEVTIPEQLRGLSADAIELADGQSAAEVVLKLDATAQMPQSAMSVKLRATMLDERGLPVVDEADVRIVDVP